MNDTSYSPQTGDILSPGVTSALSEFYGFVGDCGQAAAQILTSAISGVIPSATNLNASVNDMIGKGLASSQGITSSQALVSELGSKGIAASVVDNWRMALADVTTRPVELLLANANALPNDAGVFGHFITAVGYSPSTGKFIVSDPNSQAAKTGKFVLYSADQLAAARPVNAILLANPTGGGNPLQGVGTALGSVTGGIGSYSADVLSAGLTSAGNALGRSFASTVEKSLGVSSAKDLGIRTLLLIAAFMLLLLGFFALIIGTLRRNTQTLAPAAQTAAIAA